MKVRVFHTPNGVIIGYHDESKMRNVQGRLCEVVVRPVLLSLGEKSVSMTPLFTITREDEYCIPRDTLVFAQPMDPNPSLEATYLGAYAKQTESLGFDLTTYPTETPDDQND